MFQDIIGFTGYRDINWYTRLWTLIQLPKRIMYTHIFLLGHISCKIQVCYKYSLELNSNKSQSNKTNNQSVDYNIILKNETLGIDLSIH